MAVLLPLLASLAALTQALGSTAGCSDPPGRDALLWMPGTALPDVADPGGGLELLVPGPTPDSHGCFGKVQPGTRMLGGCTMGWVLRDAEGALYITTAGHCAPATGGPVSVDGVGFIGTVAFTIHSDNGGGVGNDVAVVRIDPALYDLVDPTMCHWGGPTGAGRAELGETVLVHGNGFIYGMLPATRPRVGEGVSTSATTVTYVGFAQGGDSGMPIMTEGGEAVGIHTHSEIGLVLVRIDPARKFGTFLEHAMDLAGAALGTTFEVETSDVPVSLTGTP